MAKDFTIGPKLAIDGEAEFKKAVANINKEMTVLGSEMKKVTAQYADNADSVEALTAKSEVYQKQIDEQKKKILTLKEALENASNEYGENSDKVKEWQIKLNNAEASLAKTESALKQTKTQIDGFGDEANDAAKETDKLGDEMDQTGKKAISFGDILKANLVSDAITAGLHAIGSAISAAFGQLKQLASDAMDAADELTTLASETGFTTEKLQEMQFIGDDLGVSLDTQTGALAKMINNMSSAKAGTGAAAEAFAKLGIDVTDANGELRDSNEVYGEVLDKLSGVANETERTAMAQDIFGRSASELNPLIEAGSAGLADLAQKAKDSGAIMSGETVASLDSLGDSVDHLKQSAQTAAGTLLGKFAPALDDVATGLTGLLSGSISVEEFMETVSGLIDQVLTTLTSMVPDLLAAGSKILITLINGLMAAIPELIPAVTQIVLQLVNTLLSMLPQILQMGLTIIMELAFGIAEALPELIPTIVDTLLMIVETLIDNIDMLIDAALAIIMGLAEGLITALPRLVDKIPVIIIKLVDAIFNNLPKIIEVGIQIIMALAKALIEAIPQLLAQVPVIIMSLIKSFANYYSKLGEVGLNLIKGLWEGIKGAGTWLKDMISGFCDDVVSSISSFFGIHSPSTVMAGIGENLSKGMAIGIDDKAGLVSDAMEKINKDLTADANLTVKATGPVSGASRPVAAADVGELVAVGRELIARFDKGLSGSVNLDGRDVGEALFDGFMKVARRRNEPWPVAAT